MRIKGGIVIVATALMVVGVQADSITHGGTTINMDFVNIGNAGVGADTTGFGAVSYNYRIGKFEVTASQWASVISADSNVGNAGAWAGSQPTALSSWFEATKFANWLTTGNAYSGAYQFNSSGTLTNVNRVAAVAAYGTVYVLPTEDEWYKAAYLKSDGSDYTTYATGNTIPVKDVDANYGGNIVATPWNVGTGTIENNGTFDMGGNVQEWNEAGFDGKPTSNPTAARGFRGGAYNSFTDSNLRSSDRVVVSPTTENHNLGFRVAAIPEPSSIMLMGVAGGFALFIRRRFRN